MSNSFIAAEDKDALQQAGLDTFEALWALQLDDVDEPNTERGGVSTVSRITIANKPYFLKRQVNHLIRTIIAPFGEPTFAYEFRNIQYYQELNIPTLKVAFFGIRTQGKDKQAILLTHELTDWVDLNSYLALWDKMTQEKKQAIINACGSLLKKLHDNKILHGCFYPKHIFLKEIEAKFDTCLIDLEKSRRLYLKRDRIKDIETLIRRTKHCWQETEFREFLAAYLTTSKDTKEVDDWLSLVYKRNKSKETRS